MSFQDNDFLTTQAVEVFIDRKLRSQAWMDILQSTDSNDERIKRVKVFLDEQFFYKSAYQGIDLDALVADFMRDAKRRHQQHCGNVHQSYAKDAGLLSRRGTNRFRYAPTDLLLKTLVLANVTKPVNASDFLRSIHDRYGLVFGPEQAQIALGETAFENDPFKANVERLEDRLRSMGILRRLSDGCAYVSNPTNGGSATNKAAEKG